MVAQLHKFITTILKKAYVITVEIRLKFYVKLWGIKFTLHKPTGKGDRSRIKNKSTKTATQFGFHAQRPAIEFLFYSFC